MSGFPGVVRAAVRLHRASLAVHPRAFRERFGAELVEDFECAALDVYAGSGWAAVVRLLARALADTLATALTRRRMLGSDGRSVTGWPIHRKEGGDGMSRSIWRDVVVGMRMLARRPVYTLVAVGTLALGIGANAAIFSVVNGVLVRPLPFPDADRLVRVYHSNARTGEDRWGFSLPDRRDWAERTTSMESFAVYSALPTGPLLTGGDEAVELRTAYVSAGFFDVMERPALLGRTLRDDEERGDNHVVVLSHAFWQRRYGGDEAIVGSTVQLDDAGYLVAGVMPPDFRFPSPDIEAWMFLTVIDPSSTPLHLRQVRFLDAIGRMTPGTSVEQATQELSSVAASLVEVYPDDNEDLTGAALVPLHESVTGGVEATLYLLLGAVGLVLLIACANVANLLLSRGLERGRELAVRRALGAGRGALVGQLLTESALLSLAGGLTGIALAYWSVRAVVARAGDLLPRAAEVDIDGAVLLFSAAITVLTALAFGLLPALKISRHAGTDRLAAGARRGADRSGTTRTWGVLVGAQVGLATLVVIASGLLLRSLWELQTVDVGFEPDGLVTLMMTMNDARYPERTDYMAFYDQLLLELEQVPGVASVASIRYTPLRRDGETGSFTIPDRPNLTGADLPEARFIQVSPGLFETARVPVLGGRGIARTDDERSAPVVVVNEALRRRYWPDVPNPVGRTVQVGSNAAIEVVGLVGDMRQSGLERDPVPTIYVSQYQNPRRGMAFMIRAEGGADTQALLPSLRAAVRGMDPDQPITELAPMNDVVYSAAAQPRFFSMLLTSFGLLAVLLSSFGIYGVVNHSVSRRVSEIGIRVALGASGKGVVRMIMIGGMRPVVVGAALGLVAALVATRSIRSVLFGVSALDPLTFATVPLLLVGVAAWACWVPAARAVRIDPTEALRAE